MVTVSRFVRELLAGANVGRPAFLALRLAYALVHWSADGAFPSSRGTMKAV